MALCFPDEAIWPDPTFPDSIGATEDQVQVALGLAWTTLQTLSAYQIAICPVTVRPGHERYRLGSYFVAPVLSQGRPYSPFFPQVQNGVWTNIWCGEEVRHVEEVFLPGPVGSIESVQIDGVVIDPSAYRVDDGNRLVRQDGELWPTNQNFNVPDGMPGSFSVTYYHGATADVLVQYAAGVLAEEYLKAMFNRDCRLPLGATTIVRQGITVEVQQDFFDGGRTGIHEVDAVIFRFNPYGQKTQSAIFSLDTVQTRTTTYTPGL